MAAFLGGALAAAILIGNDFAKCGDKRRRNLTYLPGALVSLGLIWALLQIPENIIDRVPNVLCPAITSGVAFLMAEKLQDALLRRHAEAGAEKASGWAVFG